MKLLEEMSWPEIEAGLKQTRTVILPVGAELSHAEVMERVGRLEEA